MRIAIVLSVLSIGLAGCAQQKVWEKPGSSQSDFGQDRYACLQQSQQPSSGAYVNRYGGFASSNIITNGGLFDACMNSRGWNLTTKNSETGSTPYKDAIDALDAEARENCTREEIQAFIRKAPCFGNVATLEQLSDKSKISSNEKATLSSWRKMVGEHNKKVASTHRQYSPQNGNRLAEALEKLNVAGDQLALELYNGKITWGEFNKRRLELGTKAQEDFKNAASTR